MARLFVAIDFPDAVVSELEKCQPVSASGVRCSSRDQLHLTLHFLADASTVPMAAALGLLRMDPFSLTIEGVGAFEGKNRETILWAGIQENDSLLELHRKVADCLATEGFQAETRPFRPHITIARCGHQVHSGIIRTFLDEHADLFLPGIHIDQVTLYSSTLTARGPKYQCEQTVPLSAG